MIKVTKNTAIAIAITMIDANKGSRTQHIYINQS